MFEQGVVPSFYVLLDLALVLDYRLNLFGIQYIRARQTLYLYE